MSKSGLAILCCLGVLAATGIALGTPCCTLTYLVDYASVTSPDCCDNPDCCRGEKHGTTQAEISIKPPELGAPLALASNHPLPVGEASVRPRAVLARLAFFEADLPPPPGGRDTHLKNSLFRI